MSERSVRAIGVSNFNVAQLQELLAWARVPPAVVQQNTDPLRQVGGAEGGWGTKDAHGHISSC